MSRPIGPESRGINELEALARRLKEVGDNELRKKLLRDIRAEAKPLTESIKRDIPDYLPHRGGAADAIQSTMKVGVRNRLSGKSIGIRLQGTGGRRRRNVEAIEKGILRHPVFGKRGTWANTSIRPGFFTKPIEADAPIVRESLVRVIEEIARRVERG